MHSLFDVDETFAASTNLSFSLSLWADMIAFKVVVLKHSPECSLARWKSPFFVA